MGSKGRSKVSRIVLIGYAEKNEKREESKRGKVSELRDEESCVLMFRRDQEENGKLRKKKVREIKLSWCPEE